MPEPTNKKPTPAPANNNFVIEGTIADVVLFEGTTNGKDWCVGNFRLEGVPGAGRGKDPGKLAVSYFLGGKDQEQLIEGAQVKFLCRVQGKEYKTYEGEDKLAVQVFAQKVAVLKDAPAPVPVPTDPEKPKEKAGEAFNEIEEEVPW